MNDNLGYKTDGAITSFTLAAGTELAFGSETIIFPKDTDVFVRKGMTRDAVVETIFGAGQQALGANQPNFPYTDKRDGKEYAVTYGGRGQRIETEIVPEPEAPKKKSKK
jgi:hypothetical protein